MPTPRAYDVIAGQMGGVVNVPFTKHDMYNKQEKLCEKEIIDARGVLAFLRGLKEKDSSVVWKHTIDEQGRLDKLFWCDGCSKVVCNYSVFGDVLAFDATYKK